MYLFSFSEWHSRCSTLSDTLHQCSQKTFMVHHTFVWSNLWNHSSDIWACPMIFMNPLGKFARGSNLVLVFEAMQSKPITTFPEISWSWHDYPEQYFGRFGLLNCLPSSIKWRYIQNYDVNKWQLWIREAFLSQISASPEARDGWHCW